MSRILTTNAGVTYPVIDAGGRSLKARLLGRRDDVLREVPALREVNLDLRDGARLGLLGLNGAGKSTLLKMLAGIYAPTTGSVRVEGRIAPMFDIGLGMDGDLTGYENMRIRAQFLGMTPAQIAGIREEIADFTGLADFLNLPVRTYSAGMYIRLAFAIVTAASPEVLLMDEGLGTGDAEFQARAQQRLDSFMARAGILVLASHNTEMLRRFCTQVMVLDRGSVMFHGATEAALGFYASLSREVAARD